MHHDKVKIRLYTFLTAKLFYNLNNLTDLKSTQTLKVMRSNAGCVLKFETISLLSNRSEIDYLLTDVIINKVINTQIKTDKIWQLITGGMDMPEQAKRFILEDNLVLTYKGKGWALIGNNEELIASDKIHANIKVPYKDGKTMLEFIEDVIAQDLGTPIDQP